MRILVDTNVLVRLLNSADQDHGVAAQALELLNEQGHEVCIVPQIVYELWVVGTRPTASNGLGLAANDAQSAVAQFCRLFTLLRDEATIFDDWLALVAQLDVRGKSAHDARLVAAAHHHGISEIVTFNADDFRRFSVVAVRTPAEVTR
jgi:predicted nucleic acid-binding protein